MIIKEFYRVREDGVKLFHTYSDDNKMIIRSDGAEYVEAIDTESSNYTYTESEKDMPESELPEDAEIWGDTTKPEIM